MKMQLSDSVSKKEFKTLDTDTLRENFVFNLFKNDEVKKVYTYYDRVILMGAIPVKKTLDLSDGSQLHADYILENREMGIVCISNSGKVLADNETYTLNKNEAVYLGKGTKKIQVQSLDSNKPAVFYVMCVPAHKVLPNKVVNFDSAIKENLGSEETMNKRTIYKLLHPDVLETCQLSMGITCLESGSSWNTMPCHTHERRMEAYLYFDLSDENVVFHFMGEKDNTKHVVMQNRDAVINPPWSVHFGVGTKNYNFLWGMAGENKVFGDMDHIEIKELK